MTVEANISDLFFNRDLSKAEVYNFEGSFIGYSHPALLEEASMMLENLENLGVSIPTAKDLVSDFYSRT